MASLSTGSIARLSSGDTTLHPTLQVCTWLENDDT